MKIVIITLFKLVMELNLEKQKTNVLIASANSLFRSGILKILSNRQDFKDLNIEQASDGREVVKKYSRFEPSILIIDFDDKNIKKKIFMSSFFKGQHNAQLLLVSLEQSGDVVFYDRHIFSTEEAHRWLQVPWNENKSFLKSESLSEE